MLLAAAFFLLAVAAMRSVLGGRNLINPICRSAELPIIFESRHLTVLTLQFGWHFLSGFWILTALLLVALHCDSGRFVRTFLIAGGGFFALCGLVALIAGRGRHLSLVCFFFPIGALLPLSGANSS